MSHAGLDGDRSAFAVQVRETKKRPAGFLSGAL
jgi:hypothetical protein